jgi:hypothetical protein
MSAALREAVARIRHDVEFGHAHGDDSFLLAVADWLDEQASIEPSYGHPLAYGSPPPVIHGPSRHAVAIARAYLGSDQ